MTQDANEWRTLFKRANQLLRATTHPAAVQLPVEGSLPSLAGATQWLNLWAHRYGESGTQALAEELRQLPWRMGRD